MKNDRGQSHRSGWGGVQGNIKGSKAQARVNMPDSRTVSIGGEKKGTFVQKISKSTIRLHLWNTGGII